MSFIEWKRGDLIDLVQHDDKLRSIKGDVVAHCYNAKQKVFCDSWGTVHIFYRNWESVCFQTNSGLIRLCAVTNDSSNLLVILSQETTGIIQLQVFNLNKISLSGAPCLATAKWNTLQSLATVIQVFNFNGEVYIVIGLENGDIYLHRGALSRDISSNFRCHSICTQSITGIEFNPKTSHTCTMFVASNDGIYAYTLSEASDVNASKVVLDAKSYDTRCAAMYRNDDTTESYFTVGRDDAVYCFSCDDRGPCYAIAGKKSCLAWTGKNQLVIVLSDTPQLIIIDIDNKIIILQKEMESIIDVIIDAANCYIITKSKKVYLLQDRDLHSKVSLLIERNLLDLANRLLENSTSDDGIGELYLKFGDHLLATGDVGAAVDKYKKTVGTIDPYCVISKLLDSRYTKILAEYLSVLVRTTFATEKHKELLQNCNNRLELSDKVERLCMDSSEIDSEKTTNTDYMNTSIFLKLINDPTELCKRLKNMDEDEIYDFFINNGRSLVRLHPSKVIVVVKDLCCKSHNDNGMVLSPERFIPVLMDNSNACIDFLEHIVRTNSTSSQTIYHFLLELYLRECHRAARDAADVMRYIQTYSTVMCASNVVVLCRNYSFWNGITYMFEQHKQHHLCMRYLIKSRDFQSALACAEHCADLHIWTQTLSKQELILDNSINLNSLLQNMVKEKQQSLLQILCSIFGNELILVQHVKDFFTQKHHHTLNGCEEQTLVNIVLCEELQTLNALLRSFFIQPIEFRSSICYICWQQLKFPAVYFLCQHSFHKKCIRAYTDSDVCVTCSANKKQRLTPDHEAKRSVHMNNHLVEYVSQLLSCGIFNDLCTDRRLVKDIRSVQNAMLPTVSGRAASLEDGNGQWAGHFSVSRSSAAKRTPFKQQTVHLPSKNPFENDADAYISNGQWAGRFSVSKSSPAQRTEFKQQTLHQPSTNPFENDPDAHISAPLIKDYDANLNPFGE